MICVYCNKAFSQLNGELFENLWFCSTTHRTIFQIKRNDELMRQRRELIQRMYQGGDPNISLRDKT